MPRSKPVQPKLTTEQIDSILDQLVPLIANPEDIEFFRGVIRIKAEESTAPQFAHFISSLFKHLQQKSNNQQLSAS